MSERIFRELVGGPLDGNKVELPESQTAYVIVPKPDEWTHAHRWRGTYSLAYRNGSEDFEWEGWV